MNTANIDPAVLAIGLVIVLFVLAMTALSMSIFGTGRLFSLASNVSPEIRSAHSWPTSSSLLPIYTSLSGRGWRERYCRARAILRVLIWGVPPEFEPRPEMQIALRKMRLGTACLILPIFSVSFLILQDLYLPWALFAALILLNLLIYRVTPWRSIAP